LARDLPVFRWQKNVACTFPAPAPRKGQDFCFSRIRLAPDAADNGISKSIHFETSSPALKGCLLLSFF
jgi:hypothetical protein